MLSASGPVPSYLGGCSPVRFRPGLLLLSGRSGGLPPARATCTPMQASEARRSPRCIAGWSGSSHHRLRRCDRGPSAQGRGALLRRRSRPTDGAQKRDPGGHRCIELAPEALFLGVDASYVERGASAPQAQRERRLAASNSDVWDHFYEQAESRATPISVFKVRAHEALGAVLREGRSLRDWLGNHLADLAATISCILQSPSREYTQRLTDLGRIACNVAFRLASFEGFRRTSTPTHVAAPVFEE